MSEIPMGAPGIPAAPGGPGGQPGPAGQILVAFAEPADQRRLTVLVRLILAIPHVVVLWALGIAAEVVALICWFAALFTGRLPDALAEYQVGYLRWATRFYAYLFLLTDEYPPFEFADADYPVRLRAEPGPLNRLAVLFRIILVIPAWIVSLVLGYGLSFLVMFVTWLIVLITSGASAAAADRVRSDANQASDGFTRLAKVTSAAQYQQVVASTGLEALLRRFDADYQALGTTLGVR